MGKARTLARHKTSKEETMRTEDMKRTMAIVFFIGMIIAFIGVICVLKVHRAYESKLNALNTEYEAQKGDIEYLRASLGDAYSEINHLKDETYEQQTEIDLLTHKLSDAEQELLEVTEAEYVTASELEEVTNATEELISNIPQMTYQGEYKLTGYVATGNPCANGNYPTVGYTVASNYFPLGTKLYIAGLGVRVVEDRGGMSNDVIDVFMSSESECYAITGSRKVWVIK